jgi:hypothetical protein
MLVLVVLTIAAAAVALSTRGRAPDLPERLVAFSAKRLPDHRRAWGQALVAELTAIHGPRQRWLFAAGVLRTALFPPAQRPASVRAAAAVGVLATVGATVAVASLVPTLSVFMAAWGLLTTGCAVVLAGRWPQFPENRSHLASAGVAISGVFAVTGAVFTVAITHPVATRDRTHVFSLMLAATLSIYLVAGLSATANRDPAPLARWGGVAGASAAVVASVVLSPTPAVVGLISPVVAAGTFVTAVLVGVLARDRAVAVRAGVLSAVLSAPIHFAMTIMALQYSGPSALTNPYDLDAYPRSNYPDVASYLLSDALGGNIVRLAAAVPAMYVLATIGAVAAAGRKPVGRPDAPPAP